MEKRSKSMSDRWRTWVAAIAFAVLVSFPSARPASAEESDLWAAAVEDLAASPLQDDAAELPDAVLEPATDGSLSGRGPEEAAAPVRMEALARAAAPTISPNTGIFDSPVKVMWSR